MATISKARLAAQHKALQRSLAREKAMRERLARELREARLQRAATAAILKVIAGSPADVKPVFDAIVQSALKLFTGCSVGVWIAEGDRLRSVATAGDFAQLPLHHTIPLGRESAAGAAIIKRAVISIRDTEGRGVPRHPRENGRRFGFRAIASAPMLRAGAAIGAISVLQRKPGGLSESQIALLKTFADQAVIAIENARLFNETKEALERQTATAEILKVIASSPSDVQPVFEEICASARRLLDADGASLSDIHDNTLHIRATSHDAGTIPRAVPIRGEPNLVQLVEQRQPVIVDDIETHAGTTPILRDIARARGFRSIAHIPMMRESVVVGMIAVERRAVGGFSEREVGLLQTFADQAVIAIENVRLFNETKQALERQTATAEILKVIAASPSDVQPVFETIARCAVSLCGALFANVFRFDRSLVHYVASDGLDDAGIAIQREKYPMPPNRSSISGRALLERSVVRVVDSSADTDYDQAFVAAAGGARRMIGVPMVRQGEVLGVIVVAWNEPGAILPSHEQLLATFADQAAIAVENVRLFNETKEALEQQTATAEILKVISASPTDVKPVFDAITRIAARLLEPASVALFIRSGDQIDLGGFYGPLSLDPYRSGSGSSYYPLPFDPEKSAACRAMQEGHVLEFPDTEAPGTPMVANEQGRKVGYRSLTHVPLMREGVAIGSLGIAHPRAGFRLSPRQLSLMSSFADQAVIAIENVRLFNETKEALERQTATAEILKVIASSPSDVQPVFDAIVHSVSRLFGRKAALRTVDAEGLRRRARSYEPAPDEYHGREVEPIDRASIVGQAVLEGRPLQWRDTLIDGAAAYGLEQARRLAFRSIASAPLMRDGRAIGVISVSSPEPGELTHRQMELLATFADQAVIAIENVRLFRELNERTEALSRSVQQLTALSDVGRAISSTLELKTVLQTIVSRAVALTGLDGGSIYEYEERSNEFHLRAGENMPQELVDLFRAMPIRMGEGIVGSAALRREPVELPDIRDESYQARYRELLLRHGYRAILAVPLLREDQIIGAITVNRNTPGEFAPEIVELLRTFATQSALAIQNARLFREIEEKGRQLELASQHKSQFLASMSHELRTPLNAILGFNEMILGGIYGDVPRDMQEPLADIQTSGKHLLRLINNVLDLAKIEAGRMELARSDYSVHDLIEGVRATLRPLADSKGLEFVTSVPADLPLAHGDTGRLTQCLMNLAGNSLKFTRQGRVELSVVLNDALLVYCVSDTGIGIPPEKIDSLFTEFKQTDATIASEYGGTGLGLSITRKFVEMHGGRIWVESVPGEGSSFFIEVPLRVGERLAA